MSKVISAVVGAVLIFVSWVVPGTQGWLTEIGWSSLQIRDASGRIWTARGAHIQAKRH
jgi:hypothetical protein